jgi:hypothetical protein
VTVMVFLCVSCLATWRVLPAFLTRCLWRAWAVAVVEGVVAGTWRSDEPPVPGRTQRRWRGRLAQTARVPGQVLATSGSAALRGVVQGLGLDGDRRALATDTGPGHDGERADTRFPSPISRAGGAPVPPSSPPSIPSSS